MQRTNSFLLFLSAALTVGLVQLLGCAGPAEPRAGEEAAPAPQQEVAEAERVEEVVAQAVGVFQRAQKAYDEERYDRAGELYSALLEEPEGLPHAQIEEARERLDRIESILHERRLQQDKKQAADLLVAAASLCADSKHQQAAAKLTALRQLEEHLNAEQEGQFQRLREAVEEATGILPAMTADEAEDKAEEYLDLGVDQYDAKQYAGAKEYLDRADLLKDHLGFWGRRKLRKVRTRVLRTLNELLADYTEGKRLFEEQDYARAEKFLDRVADSGISIGAEADNEVKNLLAQIEGKIAEQERLEDEQAAGEQRVVEESKAEEQRLEDQGKQNLAGGLLAEARALSAEGDLHEAGHKLTELTALVDYLGPEQKGEFLQLCEAVEDATGILPGMTEKEMEQRADQYLDDGVAAYKARQYAQAKPLLDSAALLEEHLGFWGRRKLRRVRRKVDETLTELLADYSEGVRLYEEQDYAQAREALRRVADSGISIGTEPDQKTQTLLVEIEGKIAEQQAYELARRQATVAALLDETVALSAEKPEQAMEKLAELDELDQYLTDGQRNQVQALRAAIEGAAEIAELERTQREAETLERQAVQSLRTRAAIMAKVRDARQAWQEDEFETAKSLLLDAQQLLQSLDLSAMPVLSEVAGQVEQDLAVVDVEIGLARMVEEAGNLARSDLLAAEKKALEAQEVAEREGLALTARQQQACDAVLAAVDAQYGVQRRLRSEQFRRLADLGDDYCDVGEHDKAVRMLSLVKEAGDDMVTERYRNYAAGKLAAAEQAAQEQTTAAEGVRERLAEARAELAGGQLHKALDSAATVVPMAREQSLSGELLAGILEQNVAFLETEFEPARASAYPGMKELVDAGLAQARARTAYELSEYYLGNDSPELAEPYLKRLTSGGPAQAQYVERAQGLLQGIEQRKVAAQRQRLLEVRAETQRVYDLAGELHRIALEGDLEEAEAVRQQLADARLELEAKKAQNALTRGAFTEAARLLEQAPLEAASSAAQEEFYRPLSDLVASLRQIAGDVQAADESLAACELEAAVEHLQAAQAADVDGVPEARPLAIRKDALAEVLDSVRDIQDVQMALREKKEGDLQRVRACLADARAREQAWRRYYDATNAFLLDEPGAVAALRTVVADPAGLHPFELEEADRVVVALAEWEAPAVLANDEQRAEALYEQAVEAYAARDAELVHRLLRELKARYSHTKVYREHL